MKAMKPRSGLLVDPARPVRFHFDGHPFEGLAGDTLASALIANGVHLMGRSFKYHRPRGPLSAGSEEPNALVTISRGPGRETPNLRATEVEIHDGLVARSQNRFPSLGFDIGALNGLIARFIPAGFYYKTFMGPHPSAWLWHRVFEPAIRQAAGLGRAPTAPDPDHYGEFHAHCDVLVIGAGPAGLSAALDAAHDPACRVVLCDEQAHFGGWAASTIAGMIDGIAAREWLAATLDLVRRMPNIRLMTRTTAFGCFAQNFVALAERVTDHLAAPDRALPRERLWKMRAGRIVLATGAIERPLVFPGNDLPGIMLAGAAEALLARHGVRVGERPLVFTACDSGWHAALALSEAGADIQAIIDLRQEPSDIALIAAAKARAIPVRTRSSVTEAEGYLRVKGAVIAGIEGGSREAATKERFVCDSILVSGGWTPSLHLHSQARGKLRFDEERHIFVPAESLDPIRSVGACAGDFGAEMAGSHVGDCPQPSGLKSRAKAFVDFQNDVTAEDIRLAVREGFRSIEHVKRYTTTGMATDQGKTSNLNALAIAAGALGKSIPEVGLTTFRQPYTPVTFGTFAGGSRGDLFDPVRKTPIHGWAEARGAVFEDVGLWKRARFFPQPGEDMHAAVRRECARVRSTAGFFDASTLGKIEVAGPDSAAFLDRIYTNPVVKLAPGRCRYGLMLTEAGFIMDDGIIARLTADRFHLTTTTGGAARVLNHMEDYLQTEFPDMKVFLTSITEQWAVIAIQGPRAREILAPHIRGFALDGAEMPHMSIREGRVCGVPARVMRVSFTGELGYEINVPAGFGRAVWELLFATGEAQGAIAYGTEAMHVLRAEKGYIITGQETDGTVTPDDVGLGWAMGKAKGDFVGRRAQSMRDLAAPGRKQLVGLLTENPRRVLEEGAQIVAMPDPPAGTPALGHVTSAYMSEALGRSIALALVADGRARIGEKLHVPMPDGAIGVRVVAPVFLDPKGERLDG